MQYTLSSIYTIIAVVCGIMSLVGGIVYGVKNFVREISTIKTELENNRKATRTLMSNNIVHQFYKCKERGFVNRYELENLKRMYEEYKIMGGNGFVDECFKECMTLPLKKGE